MAVLAPVGLRAESEALIVVGLTGDEKDETHFRELGTKAEELLAKRGLTTRLLAPSANGQVKKDQVLKAIAEASARVNARDEFWLVLLGHGGISKGSEPAFQVSGPRLTASELAAALEAVRGDSKVFLGMDRSGAFLPFLDLPRAEVLTATAETGQINLPRFPEMFLRALAAKPAGSLAELGARASEWVNEAYAGQGLALTETARLRDPKSGQILTPPFGADKAVQTVSAEPGRAQASSVAAEEISIPKPKGTEAFEEVAASDETRRLLAAARAIPNPAGYPAIILRDDRTVTVTGDRATQMVSRHRVYVASEEALEDYAQVRIPQAPPSVTSRIKGARLILPDGRSLVLNPDAFNASAGNRGGALADVPRPIEVLFPQAEAGSIIEMEYEQTREAQSQLPEFYMEIPLQHEVPVMASRLMLKVPKRQAFFHTAKHLPGTAPTLPIPSETTHSAVLTWEFRDLPAFEHLPLDPPRHETSAWIGVSSFPSWNALATWYRRITEGADAGGPKVKAKAAEIASRHASRDERLMAAYEFVASLRYVAIEFGIGGIRPRTPEEVITNRYGDCKDKANLLIALLHELGIEARFVLINRLSATDTDFPGWQFNHAIVHLPGNEGGRWLDPTDTTAAFGVVAPGNVGRQALVFGERDSFLEVTPGTGTEITEDWDFAAESKGRWKGHVKRIWIGLADNEQRRNLASLSPLQRQAAALASLANLLPGASFDTAAISNPKNLAVPMEVSAGLASASTELPIPRPSLDLASSMALPVRDRPLEANDRQKLRYRQIITWSFAAAAENPSKLPPPFDRSAAGWRFLARDTWKDRQTLQREVICEIDEPRVAPADYPAVRQTMLDWENRLSQNPVPSIR